MNLFDKFLIIDSEVHSWNWFGTDRISNCL